MLLLALVVLNHVSVIDIARGVAEPDQAVEVEGTHIRAVLPAKDYRPPAGAQVLVLPGRYLMPGFVEMHAHVLFPPLDEAGRPLPSFDRETVLALLHTLLFNGITTVRDPGDATEASVAVRGLLASGVIVGPRLLTAGRILTTAPMHHALYATVSNEQEVREEVDWQANVGVDFIKLYQELPPALVHAAPWAPEYLPPTARSAYQPSMFGRIYWLEHLDLDSPAVQEMVTALVDHHVSVDPTLMAFRTKFWGDDPHYTENPRRAEAPSKLWAGFARRSNTADWIPDQYRAARAQWPKLLALVKLMYDRGVLLTVGTDTPFPWIVPGVSFHEELRLLGDAGIPAPAVLRMATLNAGRALKLNIGSIEPGKDADLVVLTANPLDSSRNTERIELIVKAGKIFKAER
jgi:imidazolonepropionase-like amidohydrolase